MIDWTGVAFAIAVTAIFFGGRWLWERRKDAVYVAQARAAQEAWQMSQPRIIEPSTEQVAELARRLPGLALPALVFEPDAAAAVVAGGSRIGGPVWLADGEQWPQGKEERLLEFVAQLDFATMPSLPDYPDAGLLQLFVARDDLHGADFDAPDKSDVRLVWHPDGALGGRTVPPPRLPKYADPDDDGYSFTPFVDDRVRDDGVVLCGRAMSLAPQSYSRPVERLCAKLGIDARARAVEPLLDANDEDRPRDCHHVGGHPTFVQNDYRMDIAYPPEERGKPSPWRDHDRVLFQLTSRDGLQWGDVGEANVMVRRADLLARDFSRAIFWWDCS